MILWWCHILVEIWSLAKFEHFRGKMSKLPLIELEMVAQIMSILMVWNTIVCQRKSKISNFEIALLFVKEIATFNSHTMAGKQQIFIRIAFKYYTNWVFYILWSFNDQYIMLIVQSLDFGILYANVHLHNITKPKTQTISCGWIR